MPEYNSQNEWNEEAGYELFSIPEPPPTGRGLCAVAFVLIAAMATLVCGVLVVVVMR